MPMLKKFFSILLITIVFTSFISRERSVSSFIPEEQEHWVDSVLASLSPEERIGQLFMVAAYSNRNEQHYSEIDELIKNHSIGGLIFFQGGPVRQAILTNRYQSKSKVPLFVAMDAEWGLSMRLDSTMAFPKQMTLGAIANDQYVYEMGKEIAMQCKRLGMQINFAPVVDINSNPANPIIGMRSFGEDKVNVASKGIAYMKGMQDIKVMANAKHFPGHGDSETDSHLTLPVINQPKERLSEIELYPFKRLIQDSLMSIMVAHLYVPAYDNTLNRATTLSKAVVTDLLKNELGFKGLAFTDALNMKGVSSFYKPGEVDLLALLAGNDVLLFAENVPVAIKKILKAIKNKDITQEEIDERVKKILRAKYWSGLNELKPVEITNLYNDLNNPRAKALRQTLYEQALTVVKNDQDLLPIKVLDTTSFASLSIGIEGGNQFQMNLDHYAAFDHYAIPNKNSGDTVFNSMLEKLKKYEVVVIGLHNTSSFNSTNFGISEASKKFIEKLNSKTKVILSVFGNPYSLKYFTYTKNLICAYEDNETTQRIVPQLIFGAIPATASLPVSPDVSMKAGQRSLISKTLQRLRYGFPESAGIDSKTLAKIDSIAMKAITDGATPGCQVLVARNGIVVHNKSYGYLSYDKVQPVNNNTLYDIASISKVAGTLQAVMFLQERGLIDLDKKASYYLTDLKGTNKEDLLLKDILTHQAGLTPFIPHWKKTVDSSGFCKVYYSTTKDSLYCNQVIPGLYSISSMEDSLWKWTVESDLIKKPKPKKKRAPVPKGYDYVYSDLGFYIMKRVVEKQINQPMDEFLQQNIYDRLGLATMTYKPLYRFSPDRVAPTEEDKYFRKCLIRCTVHDPGAAMLGGVAGHAGIFSNAGDLATLLQMNLQLGTYGGQRYLLPETLPLFTKKQFDKNRRGLGWDKPEASGGGPTSDNASPNTYGHTGFTGTAAWIDPDQNLVYIFLSNRIYTDAGNTKLIKWGTRTQVQDVIYQSILNYSDKK
jgi:beta-glucosidase-like glycosyl hydrolase/CubicO group peptidase (beta-lactamase class C family)